MTKFQIQYEESEITYTAELPYHTWLLLEALRKSRACETHQDYIELLRCENHPTTVELKRNNLAVYITEQVEFQAFIFIEARMADIPF